MTFHEIHSTLIRTETMPSRAAGPSKLLMEDTFASYQNPAIGLSCLSENNLKESFRDSSCPVSPAPEISQIDIDAK